jgi:hypothetical protein
MSKKNPNFVAMHRCSQKITLAYSAIDTLLRSSRLREIALAVSPAPTVSAAPRPDRICCIAIFCSRLALLRTLDFSSYE